MENYFDSIHPNTRSNHIIGDVLALGKEVKGALPKFGYKKFIAERDKKLNELKAKGFNSGPLLQANGFTHAQIKKNLLKDYTEDYQRFLDTVYYPLIGRQQSAPVTKATKPAAMAVTKPTVTVSKSGSTIPVTKELLDMIPSNIRENIAITGKIPADKTAPETLPKTENQKALDIATQPKAYITAEGKAMSIDFSNPLVITGIVILAIAVIASIIKR